MQPPDNSDDARNNDLSRAMTGLHSWFPTQNDAINGQPATSGRQQCTHCRDEVMDSLSRLTSLESSELYAKFFNHLWVKAYSRQHRLVYRKQIIYSFLTPPRFHRNTVFIYGPTRNISIPFTRKSLLTKNQIREHGKKVLGYAILDTRLRK